ncbi:hypothetical protein G6F31_014655 [Rhizopus arrhizus]|nr:hypothetical protein G6F31_014655 [Rhizopus arrhizus]
MAHQQARIVSVRIGVTRAVFELRIVVAELDQQHVAAAKLAGDRLQAPFVDEAARAAPALGVVVYFEARRVQVALQRLAPARLRRTLRPVLGGGGVTGDEQPHRRRLRGGAREQQQQQQVAHGGAPVVPAAGRQPH